jgi:N6-L-threonylcarbamoyladenine synthase
VIDGDAGGVRVLSEVVYSQAVHARFGGVVPEIASRAHIEQVLPTVRAALAMAVVDRPDAIAVTAGPGLIGAVLVGLAFAKGAASGWGVPLYAVNHLEGHLLSCLLEEQRPAFPFLSLVISGGHTTLYVAHAVGRYEVVAETEDDAVGECFDKVARVCGLGYPGGPKIDALAPLGRADALDLPRPRLRDHPWNWSFSGIKSSVRQQVERRPGLAPADIAASFQATVTRYLVDRVVEVAEATGIPRVAIGGGAAANSGIRTALSATGLELFLPPRRRCTDNAAMIANVGRLRAAAGGSPDPLSVTARPRWPVGEPAALSA